MWSGKGLFNILSPLAYGFSEIFQVIFSWMKEKDK